MFGPMKIMREPSEFTIRISESPFSESRRMFLQVNDTIFNVDRIVRVFLDDLGDKDGDLPWDLIVEVSNGSYTRFHCTDKENATAGLRYIMFLMRGPGDETK